MAFSTFRFFMAASSSITPPPPGNTNVFTPHVASYILNNSAAVTSTSTITNNIILAGDANYVLATTSDPASSNDLYASLVEKGTSFDVVPATTASKRLTGNYGGNPVNQVSGDTVSSTAWLMSYIDTSSNVFSQYLTRSSNTLTVSVGATTIYSGGDATTCKTCVLDSSHAIVLANNGTTTSPGTNTFTLINSTTLAIISSVTNGSGGVSVQPWQSLIGLTSTLGVFLSVNTGYGLQAQGIDRSGTSLTINSLHSIFAGLPNSNSYNTGLFGACKVSNSTILVAYYKSVTPGVSTSTIVIGARIVTVASGGTITLGTEKTYSVTTADANANNQSVGVYTPAILSSTAAVISFSIGSATAVSSGYSLFALPLAISGTTITLSTPIYPLESFQGMYLRDGNMCAVDSTHVAVQWLEDPTAFGSTFNSPINDNLNRAVFIDVNNATPTWVTIGSKKSYTSLATLSTSVPSTSVTYACPLQLYIVDNAANLPAYVLSNESIYVSGVTYNGSSASGHLPKICNMTFYDGGAIPPTIQTLQVSRNSSGSMRAYIADGSNSTSNGTYSVSGTIGTTRNSYQIIYYGAVNQNFFIYSNGTSDYSGGIVDTTSGITSITYADQVFITSSTLGTGFTAPALASISTTAILMAYVDGNNIKAVIFTMSGDSITVGTPVTVFSGTGTPTLTAGVAVLSSTNGIITYSNTGTSTVLYSNGITWSGSTITVGTQSTVLTSQSFTKDGYNIASKSVPVSPTQAIYTYWDNGATAVRALLLTYVSINSITAGTPFSVNTNVSSTYADLSIGLVATETGNAIVAVQNYENTSSYETDAQYLYRG